jgi:hypothetical protein
MTRDHYFQALKEKIGSLELGETIARKDLMLWTSLVAGSSYISYMDQFRSHLVKAGYISNPASGIYRYEKIIPPDLKSSRLFEQAYPENDKVIFALRKRRQMFVVGNSAIPKEEQIKIHKLLGSENKADVKIALLILESRFDYTD